MRRRVVTSSRSLLARADALARRTADLRDAIEELEDHLREARRLGLPFSAIARALKAKKAQIARSTKVESTTERELERRAKARCPRCGGIGVVTYQPPHDGGMSETRWETEPCDCKYGRRAEREAPADDDGALSAE